MSVRLRDVTIIAAVLADATPAMAISDPALVSGTWKSREYLFQPAASGAPSPAPLLVYLHGMQRGDAVGIERQVGYLDALSRWAAAHGHALLVPLAPKGRCEGVADANRDWRCWPVAGAPLEARRLDRLVDGVAKVNGGFAARRAVGLSRGAYFLSVAWARGALGRWQGIGLLSGAQAPPQWHTRRAPPLAIEYGARDPGNAAFVASYLAALRHKAPNAKACVRETSAGHLPDVAGFTDFLDFAAVCWTSR